MQIYHVISEVLKIISKILIAFIVIYIVYLSTNSLKYLWNNNLINYQITENLDDFIFNTYIITLIVELFVIGYFTYKNKYSISKIFKLIILCILLLPVAVLINYNFNLLNSFMSSFYLIVVLVLIMLSIKFFTMKIDNLYKIAVEGSKNNKDRKGEFKNGRKNKLSR